jgi:PAS domain S-box-containing protein
MTREPQPDNREALRKALLDLKNSLLREGELRRESEVMVAASQEIRPGRSAQELFVAIMDHLQPLFGFSVGELYAQSETGWLRMASTAQSENNDVRIASHPLLHEIAKGRIHLFPDLQVIPGWSEGMPKELAETHSAILLPLTYEDSPLIGIAGHEDIGVFSSHHQGLAQKFIPIMNQALSVIASSRANLQVRALQSENQENRDQIALLDEGTRVLGVGLFRWDGGNALEGPSDNLCKMAVPWGDCNGWWSAVREAVDMDTFSAALKRGEPLDLPMTDSDGSLHFFRFHLGVCESREQMPVLVTDLTTERLAKEERRRANQRYSALFQSSPDGILVHDQSGIIRDANIRAEEMLGAGNASLVGRSWSDFFPSERIEDFSEAVLEGVSRYESVLRRGDGSTFHAEVHTQILSLEGERLSQTFLRNISERKEAERILRASEAQKSASLAAALDAVVTLDQRGKVIEFNPAAEKIFGWSCEEAFGLSLTELFIPEELRGAHSRGMKSYLQTGEAKVLGQRMELPAVCKDGNRILLEVAITRIPGPDGQSNFTGFMRDITQQKADQEGLRLAKEEAEQANRSKTDFLAAMSHELRTPLHVIAGMTELAIAERPPSEVENHLQVIESSARCLLELIGDLLDYGQIESGEFSIRPAATNLKELLNEIHGMTAHRMESRGLKLIWDVPKDLPYTVDLDRIRVRQVLLNLLGNAEKFTKKGFVGLSLQIDAKQKKPCLTFEIRDSGVGFPQAQADKLFRRFSQLDQEGTTRSHGGAGLGLAISRALTELMGGSIEAFSKPGLGSMFRVILPLQTVEPQKIAGSQATEPELASGHSVLLIDDHSDNRELATHFLEKSGMVVQQASSGMQAIKWLSTGNTCDVILMDIEMPQMDGMETTSRIQSLLKDKAPPILALTAHAVPGFRERCIRAGMASYLSKPFGQKDLLQAIVPLLMKPDATNVEPPGSELGLASPSATPIHDPCSKEIFVDADAMDLVSGYVANCMEMVDQAIKHANSKNVEQLLPIFHKLKGSGASFGIPKISRLGQSLHVATQFEDWDTILDCLNILQEYLASLEVIPKDPRI